MKRKINLPSRQFASSQGPSKEQGSREDPAREVQFSKATMASIAYKRRKAQKGYGLCILADTGNIFFWVKVIKLICEFIFFVLLYVLLK